MKTAKILLVSVLLIAIMLLLAGCGKSYTLTLTLSDCGDDDVEAFVTVLDKNKKDCGGGNLVSGGGNLTVSVPNGTYTISIDNIIYDGSGIYAALGEQTVTVKGDTSYTVQVEKSVEMIPPVEPVVESVS